MPDQERMAQSGVGVSPETGHYDLVIVGAGFGGLYMLHRARALGLRARVFERGDDVGGTWYWNRYPGARCDIESLEYSYSFDEALQQEWRWSERFAPQAEILAYARHVAERFDLRRDIRFSARVGAVHFDGPSGCWQVRVHAALKAHEKRMASTPATTTDGLPASTEEPLLANVTAQFVVMATGCLSSTNLPDIAGMADFAGPVLHTGSWPREGVDFSGRRVGVIGTGSSAIQSIPVIAEQARELVVFQRTPNYSVPAHNAPLDPEYETNIKSDYAAFRDRNRQMMPAFGSNSPEPDGKALTASAERREAVFEKWWQRGGLGFTRAFEDLMLDPSANQLAAEFVRGKIRAIVNDPHLAEKLLPKQVIGCKRLCVDTGYYAAFNRPNVRLIDIRESPIEQITPRGVRAAGVEYELDMLVCATGFDAMTGSLLAMDIRGEAGQTLQSAWREGPHNYLGLMVAGFPNLFMITGPGSPSVLTNMIMSIEQHVEFIADCIGWLREQGCSRIAADEQAQNAWVAHVNAVAGATVYPQCNSWYLGANVPGKARVFMPLLGFPAYVEKCNAVVADGYAGFRYA